MVYIPPQYQSDTEIFKITLDFNNLTTDNKASENSLLKSAFNTQKKITEYAVKKNQTQMENLFANQSGNHTQASLLKNAIDKLDSEFIQLSHQKLTIQMELAALEDDRNRLKHKKLTIQNEIQKLEDTLPTKKIKKQPFS